MLERATTRSSDFIMSQKYRKIMYTSYFYIVHKTQGKSVNLSILPWNLMVKKILTKSQVCFIELNVRKLENNSKTLVLLCRDSLITEKSRKD